MQFTKGTLRLQCLRLALGVLAYVLAPEAVGRLLVPLAAAQTPPCTTTITGKVFSPSGLDPLPNILVYVPTTPLTPFPAGVNSCSTQAQLVSGNPMVSTTTGFDGTFTLTNPGLAGSNVTLVIQAGKWRRQYTGINVPACQTTQVSTSMPRNSTQGDIPQIAISSGSVDALECVFRKIGIDDSEFTAPSGTGRIHLWAGSVSPGVTRDAAGTLLPAETTLVSTPATLDKYDLTLFACQGTPANPAAVPVTNQQNLVDYANIGGRIFTTHFSYVWLNNSTVFQTTANWVSDRAIGNGNTPIDATIDQSYPEGQVLAKWLFSIGATPTLGQLPLYQTKKDQSSVNNPPSQSWATLNDPADGNPVMQFTFDTPINTNLVPSVKLAFTNTPKGFMVDDTGDQVRIDVANTSAAAADPSLNLSLTLPPGVTATALAGVGAGTGWTCSAGALVCNRTTPLAGNSTDSLLLTVNVSPNAPLGPAKISAAIAGGGLSGTNQCGRVLFNEYHVETSSTGSRAFPLECTAAAMTPQEKFLEFSLYNLSNFIAPVTTDAITIQATPIVTWPAPAPIIYPTPLSSTQLNATANVPGTFTYTPAAGAVLPVGLDPLSVLFTPSEPASFNSVTASQQIQVSLIPTSLSLLLCVDDPGSLFPCGNPLTATPLISPITAYYGQMIDGVAIESTINLQGTLTFYNGNQIFCTLNASLAAGASTCPAGSGLFPVGNTQVSAIYSGDVSHLGSTSNGINVIVSADLTTATLASNLNPAQQGQPVTFTATLAGNVAVPTGTVSFYDGTTLLGSGNLDLNGQASLTTSTLAFGSHPITVVYGGTPNFNPATSAVITEVIVAPPAVLTPVVTLTSSLNPSAPGQLVTFKASVQVPGAIGYAPPGSVNFLDGTSVLATVALDQYGSAIFQTSTLTTGAHPLTASYAGVTGLGAVTPTRPPAPPQPVAPKLVTPTLVPGRGFTVSGPLASGAPVARATTPHPNAAPPTLPKAALLPAIAPAPKATGLQFQPTLLPATSAVLTQIVNAPVTTLPPGFALTVTPTPETIGAGRTGIMLVTVRPVSGFYQPVQLSCANLPPEAVCTFVQPSIPAGGGSTTLQLATQAPRDCNTNQPYFLGQNSNPFSRPNLPLTATPLAALVLLALPNRRKHLRRAHLTRSLLLMSVALLGLTAVSGCGRCTDLGTRPGTYTFSVIAVAQTGAAPAAGAPQPTTSITQTQTQQIPLTVTLQ